MTNYSATEERYPVAPLPYSRLPINYQCLLTSAVAAIKTAELASRQLPSLFASALAASKAAKLAIFASAQ